MVQCGCMGSGAGLPCPVPQTADAERAVLGASPAPGRRQIRHDAENCYWSEKPSGRCSREDRPRPGSRSQFISFLPSPRPYTDECPNHRPAPMQAWSQHPLQSGEGGVGVGGLQRLRVRRDAPPSLRSPTGQAPIGPLSRAASKGTFGVQAGEAAAGPDGEDVPVARVADGTGLIEDPGDVFLKGHRDFNSKASPGSQGAP